MSSRGLFLVDGCSANARSLDRSDAAMVSAPVQYPLDMGKGGTGGEQQLASSVNEKGEINHDAVVKQGPRSALGPWRICAEGGPA